MTNLDASRKYDLEELYKIWQKETRSDWKKEIKDIMTEIINQDETTSTFRHNLIMAIRTNDRTAVKYFTNKLLLHKQEKMNGRQF